MCTQPLGFYVTAFFILIPHLAALLSVYMRWGAVPLSIAFSIGSYIGSALIFESFFRLSVGSAVLIPAAFVVLSLCAACHVMIIRRINILAAGA